MKQKPRKKRRTMTSKMTSDLKSASIVRLSRMTQTHIERLAPWTNLIWCNQDNKQDHKRIRPVRRLCDHDEFGDANWEEQKHRAM